MNKKENVIKMWKEYLVALDDLDFFRLLIEWIESRNKQEEKKLISKHIGATFEEIDINE